MIPTMTMIHVMIVKAIIPFLRFLLFVLRQVSAGTFYLFCFKNCFLDCEKPIVSFLFIFIVICVYPNRRPDFSIRSLIRSAGAKQGKQNKSIKHIPYWCLSCFHGKCPPQKTIDCPWNCNSEKSSQSVHDGITVPDCNNRIHKSIYPYSHEYSYPGKNSGKPISRNQTKQSIKDSDCNKQSHHDVIKSSKCYCCGRQPLYVYYRKRYNNYS